MNGSKGYDETTGIEDDVNGGEEYDDDDDNYSEENHDIDEEMNVLDQSLEPMSISSSSSTASSLFLDPAAFTSYYDTSTIVQDGKHILYVVFDKFGPFYPVVVVIVLMLGIVSITKALNTAHVLIHPNTLPSSRTLLYHLTTQSIIARQRNLLITSPIISSQYASSGVSNVPDFVISIADTNQKEQEAAWKSEYPNFPSLNFPVSATSSSSIHDPLGLDSIPLDLLIDSSLTTHTLVLNKYNTFRFHALLITNFFEQQSNGLNTQDIQATIMYIQAINAVGFFNSAEVSGASQPHKHIQLVPLDSLKEVISMIHNSSPSSDTFSSSSGSASFPIDILVKASHVSIGKITSLKEIPFQNFVASISLTTLTIDDLYGLYKSMRDMCKGKEYNFIITAEWMIMVPRSKAVITLPKSVIPVNSFGFMGFLLAANTDQSEEILSHRAGVLDLLKQVTFEQDITV